MSAGMRRKGTQFFYTGSLIQSYIQFHLTPRWNPLRNSIKHLQPNQFLNTTRTTQLMLKNPISAHLALQETLSRSTNSYTFTTRESTCVKFFSAIRTEKKIAESRAEFHKFRQRIALVLHRICEKLSRNSFFLKFHVRTSTEFGTKRDRFQVKRMCIHLRKKSNSFTHK